MNTGTVNSANLPTGAISYTTLASQGLEDLTTWVRLTDLSMLQAGENVLAVEVHQYHASSSDLHADVRLVANRATAPASGPITRLYYAAGGQRVAMRENGTLYYLLTDHLGSTSIAVNATGLVVSRVGYKPWGELRFSQGVLPTELKFTGQREEAALGLYDYGARWYDPALGRFLAPDTLIPDPGNPADWDRFAYTRGNPVKYNDPTGHSVACGTDSGNGCGTKGANQTTRFPKRTQITSPSPTQAATPTPDLGQLPSYRPPAPTPPGYYYKPGATPTPQPSPAPTLTPEQAERLYDGFSLAVDVSEGMNLIHIPSGLGLLVDACTQYDADEGKGYSYLHRSARAWIVAGEGQLIALAASATSGLGTAVTIESGPLSIGVGVATYVGTNIIASDLFDYANTRFFFPLLLPIDS